MKMNSGKTKGWTTMVVELGVMCLINNLDVNEGGRAGV